MQTDIHHVMRVCLLAGKVMLENGGETYRVEDTMTRIAKFYSVSEVHSYVTPTGVFLTIVGGNDEERTRFLRISDRSIDLNKVVLVNEISRKLIENKLSLEKAYSKLEKVEKCTHLYPEWAQVLAAAVASGFFTLMFGGDWLDYIPSFIAGGFGFFVNKYLHHLIRVKFFAEIMAAFMIGSIGFSFLYFGIGNHLDKVIIGAVMPLVPGVAITNAIRDLMAGDLVSGLARGADAFLTALAIGTGVAVIIALV